MLPCLFGLTSFPSLASFFLPQCRQQLVPRELLTHLCLWTYPADPALYLKACLFSQVASANRTVLQAHYASAYTFTLIALFRFPWSFPGPTGESSMNFRPEGIGEVEEFGYR